MMGRNFRVAMRTVGLLLGPLAATIPASADTAADLFRGKTMTIAHTGGAGGGFAIYSRFVIKHLPKHIPGQPTMVLQFMPGAGGINGMNYLYSVAPKDGTFLLMPTPGVEVAPFLYPDRVKYDMTKIEWIGNVTQTQSYVTVWHTTGVGKWEDARKTEVVMGATGKGSETYVTPVLMNALLGTRFKVITGYKGIQAVDNAMEKGELFGRAGGWTGGRNKHFFESGRAKILVQVGAARVATAWEGGHDISDVPLLIDLGKNEEERQILSLQSRVLSRPLAGPPGLSAERLAVLRAAFDKMIADPAFIADLQTRNLEIIRPMNGPDTAAFVRSIASLPDRVKQRYRQAVLGP